MSSAAQEEGDTFTGGYIYITRIRTSRHTLWYAGKKHRETFDPKYHGSGKVVRFIRGKIGTSPFKTRSVAWASTLEELNDLERQTIAAVRAKYGKHCVNVMDGADGMTPEVARKLNARPSVKAKQAKATRARWADQDARAEVIRRMKIALATPEARLVKSVAASEVNSRPEVKARKSAWTAARNSRPEVKVHLAETTKAAWSDEEHKASRRKAIKDAKAAPEARAHVSRKMREVCAVPEARARLMDIAKAAWSAPGAKARRVDKMKAVSSTPEARARLARASSAVTSNPEILARRSAKIAAASRANAEASAPYRAEWLAAKDSYPGIKAPHPSAKAEVWKAFIQEITTRRNLAL